MALIAYFILVLSTVSVSLGQSTLNECSQNVLGIEDWSQISAPTQACLELNPNFATAIGEMCQNDRRQISTKLQQFLKYKMEYEDTQAWYHSLPLTEQQKAINRHRLQVAKENWDILGFKTEVRSLKARLDEIYRACDPKHE